MQTPNAHSSWFLPPRSVSWLCFPAMVPEHCRVGDAWTGPSGNGVGSQPWEKGHEHCSNGWDHLLHLFPLPNGGWTRILKRKLKNLWRAQKTNVACNSTSFWYDFWKTLMVCPESFCSHNKNIIWNPYFVFILSAFDYGFCLSCR